MAVGRLERHQPRLNVAQLTQLQQVVEHGRRSPQTDARCDLRIIEADPQDRPQEESDE